MLNILSLDKERGTSVQDEGGSVCCEDGATILEHSDFNVETRRWEHVLIGEARFKPKLPL